MGEAVAERGELERSIESMLRDAITEAEGPTSTAIAENVIDELDRDQLRLLAIHGLCNRVRRLLSRERAGGGGRTASARWDDVREAASSGQLDLARFSVYTGNQAKWLLDCTAIDLIGAADHELKQAQSHDRNSKRFAALAKMLHAEPSAEVVAELNADKVRRILDA